MKVLGVDLAANDAVICLLDLNNQQFALPDCRVRKLTLPKDHTRKDLQQFQFAFTKLIADYKIDKVAIKGRMPKGKFAGGAISFKLEAAIQLITEADVNVLSPAQIKSTLAANTIPILFANTGLKVFQEAAFTVAYVAQVME
jgi:hypothetical protein|tara:strand:+ start:3463 stop:3888 length:426 start_codon:yes stop_codon:yes gene_type:complete